MQISAVSIPPNYKHHPRNLKPGWLTATIMKENIMTEARIAFTTEGEKLRKTVKSLMVDEETWRKNQGVVDAMIIVFEDMGFLKIVDDASASGFGAIYPTPISDALDLVYMLNLACLDFYKGRIFDDVATCGEVTNLDENYLVRSYGTPEFWDTFCSAAMHLYYDYYNIARGSDEDPVRTYMDVGRLMAARGP
jgi:hypothetical protein